MYQVRTGQTVRWEGNFTAHPLNASEGDAPNPIASHAGSGVVTFPQPGIYGFKCAFHFEMAGAIQAVPFVAPAAVPWGGVGELAILAILLVGVSIRRQAVSRRRP